MDRREGTEAGRAMSMLVWEEKQESLKSGKSDNGKISGDGVLNLT